MHDVECGVIGVEPLASEEIAVGGDGVLMAAEVLAGPALAEAGPEPLVGGGEGVEEAVHVAELVVDGDAQGLEGARGGIGLAGVALARGEGGGDHGGEVERGVEGAAGERVLDGAGDAVGEGLLAEVGDQAAELASVGDTRGAQAALQKNEYLFDDASAVAGPAAVEQARQDNKQAFGLMAAPASAEIRREQAKDLKIQGLRTSGRGESVY